MASTVHIAAAKFVALGAGPYDLHPLCAKGDLKSIQEFWNRFSDQIKLLSGGYTPLQEAARKGHSSVVDFLLSKGAKVNALSSNGETALYLAAEGCHTDCEVLLMAHGASIHHGVLGKKAKNSRDKILLNILNGKNGMYLWIYVCTYNIICMYVSYACTLLRMYVCMYVCMCVCVSHFYFML